MRRARAYPPPLGPFQGVGKRVGGDPEDEREHFIKCPVCGHMIDCRNLAEVFEHEGGEHLPPLKD